MAKTLVVLGGTDGIGAALALRYAEESFDVIIIGRSEAKANDLKKQAANQYPGCSFRTITADLSLMRNVKAVASQVASMVSSVDVLAMTVGILLPKSVTTEEGVEKNFATSYLSRFVFLQELNSHGLLTEQSKALNVAAGESPNIPEYLQLEFDDIEKVRARTGMSAHGQAQLANDLFAIRASEHFQISVIAYGPGSVDTNIRREIPWVFRALLKPIFYWCTRTAEEAAQHLYEILEQQPFEKGKTAFFNKHGMFTPSPYLKREKRLADLWSVSEAIAKQALDGS